MILTGLGFLEKGSITTIQKIQKNAVVYQHTGTVPQSPKPNENVEVELITSNLIDRVISSREKQNKFESFLSNGHWGVIAHDGTDWITHGWVCGQNSTKAPYNVPDWVVELDAYWTFYGRTKKTYRNRGWHKYILSDRLERIYERETSASIFTETSPKNISRFSIEAVGFEPSGTLTTYRLGHPKIKVKQLGFWNRDESHPPLPDTEHTD